MIIECIRNEGFEDQLSENSAYEVKKMGSNSYLIENDKAELHWYGDLHFEIQFDA